MAETLTHDPLPAVRAVVAQLSEAWRAGRIDDIAPLLHEDVVFVGPGFGGRLAGRGACAESFRQFITNAALFEYAESDLTVDTWNDTAVATYRYLIDWEMDGRRSQESGHDLLVLARRDDRWSIVWRTLVPTTV